MTTFNQKKFYRIINAVSGYALCTAGFNIDAGTDLIQKRISKGKEYDYDKAGRIRSRELDCFSWRIEKDGENGLRIINKASGLDCSSSWEKGRARLKLRVMTGNRFQITPQDNKTGRVITKQEKWKLEKGEAVTTETQYLIALHDNANIRFHPDHFSVKNNARVIQDTCDPHDSHAGWIIVPVDRFMYKNEFQFHDSDLNISLDDPFDIPKELSGALALVPEYGDAISGAAKFLMGIFSKGKNPFNELLSKLVPVIKNAVAAELQKENFTHLQELSANAKKDWGFYVNHLKDADPTMSQDKIKDTHKGLGLVVTSLRVRDKFFAYYLVMSSWYLAVFEEYTRFVRDKGLGVEASYIKDLQDVVKLELDYAKSEWEYLQKARLAKVSATYTQDKLHYTSYFYDEYGHNKGGAHTVGIVEAEWKISKYKELRANARKMTQANMSLYTSNLKSSMQRDYGFPDTMVTNWQAMYERVSEWYSEELAKETASPA